MDSFGAFLKAEREKREISLEEVSKVTNIAPHILEALENDRINELPALVFVKGFIRNYAQYLGLDPTETIHRYIDFISEYIEFNQDVSYIDEMHEEGKIGFDQNKILVRVKQFNKKRAFLIFLSVLLLVFLFIVLRFYILKPKSDSIKNFPRIKYPKSFEDKTSSKRLNKTNNVNIQKIRDKASKYENMPQVEKQIDKSKKEKNLSAIKTPIDEAINTEGISEVLTGSLVVDPQENEMQNRRQYLAKKNRKELIINTLETTWIDVKIDNYPSYDLTLKPGNTVLLEAENSFSLLIGNAGGIEITFEGRNLGVIGKKGDVIRLQLP